MTLTLLSQSPTAGQEQQKYGQQPTKRPGMVDLPNKNAANGTNQIVSFSRLNSSYMERESS